MKIVVIGSINMDIVNRVERHPLPGETIMALKTEFNSGGKGANQAVAATRAGGYVSMVGAIGDDPFGKELIMSLSKNGINTKKIIKKDCKSGLAFITVNAAGENSIILEAGANGQLSHEDIISVLDDFIGKDTVILLQNEIPWERTEYIINKAYEQQIPVYLNPAPAKRISDSVLSKLKGLFVNETEAEILTGITIIDEKTVKQAASIMLKTGLSEVVITLGEKGSYYADQTGNIIFTPAYQVPVVDTISAGDTFIGAYVVARLSGEVPRDSLQFATAASALTVTKNGAQKSIPFQEQIKSEINRHKVIR